MDAFGHVHHMALVGIAEHARSRWLDGLLAPGSTWDYAVVRIAFDFRSELSFTDRVARCEFEVVRVWGRDRCSTTSAWRCGRVATYECEATVR